MKKIIAISTCSALLALSATSMAITWPWQKNKTDEKQQATKPVTQNEKSATAKEITVNLYTEASKDAKVLKKLPINADLVAIYKKDGWLKVGDRKDGQTGWINIKQYHQAKNNFYHHYFKEKTQTVYFHTDTDKDGNVKIVAYRNGKKLTEKEAQKLYDHLKKQQEQQWQEIKKFNRNMDHMMMNMYDAFPKPVIMMPGVVIIDHDQKNNDQANAHQESKNKNESKK